MVSKNEPIKWHLVCTMVCYGHMHVCRVSWNTAVPYFKYSMFIDLCLENKYLSKGGGKRRKKNYKNDQEMPKDHIFYPPTRNRSEIAGNK